MRCFIEHTFFFAYSLLFFSLFWGVIEAWNDPFIIRLGILVAFTGLHGILLGVCYITRFGLFVLLGCFTSPRLIWTARTPLGFHITGGIVYLCQPTPPTPERFLDTSLLIPGPHGGALHWKSSMASWTARFFPYWFGQGVFVTVFVVLPLEELLGLPQELDENQ